MVFWHQPAARCCDRGPLLHSHLGRVLVRTPSTAQNVTIVRKLKGLALPGTVCMVASLICLLLALQWGGSTYPWSNGRIIVLFVVSGVLAMSFTIIQKTTWSGAANTIPSNLALSCRLHDHDGRRLRCDLVLARLVSRYTRSLTTLVGCNADTIDCRLCRVLTHCRWNY